MNRTREHLTVQFGPLTIRYDERVLEPRAWTRAQSEWAAQLLHGAPDGPVLEVCSGAGHIGLLAVRDSGRRLVMVDDNPAACEHARHNAVVNGAESTAEVRCAPFDRALEGAERFALVVADPPWVPSALTGHHPDDPVHAIDGGPTGVEVAAAIVKTAAAHTVSSGSLLVQLGTPDQAKTLTREHADAWQQPELRRYERGVLLHLRRR